MEPDAINDASTCKYERSKSQSRSRSRSKVAVAVEVEVVEVEVSLPNVGARSCVWRPQISARLAYTVYTGLPAPPPPAVLCAATESRSPADPALRCALHQSLLGNDGPLVDTAHDFAARVARDHPPDLELAALRAESRL